MTSSQIDTIETKLQVSKDRLCHKLKVVQDYLTNKERDILALDINIRQLKNCQERVNQLRDDLEIAIANTDDDTAVEKFNSEIVAFENLQLDCADAISEATAICEHGKDGSEKKSDKEDPVNSSFIDPTAMALPELPQIQFDGDITSYPEFKQNFEVTIGKSKLVKNRKLAYLKTMCVGKAEKDLKGLPTTNENYASAWVILDNKYGDTKQTVEALYNKIIKLPKSNSSTTSLRTLYDEMEVIFRTLESLNETFDHNTILFTTVIEKFPKDIVYEVHQGVTGTLSLTEFRHKIRGVIQKREQLNFNTEVNELATYTTEALAVRTNTSKTIGKKLTQRCIFCASDQHWSDECDKHTTLEARKEIIKGRCFICLRRNHTFKECTSDRTCVHCGQKQNHHRSLCPKLLKENTSKPTDADTSKETKSNQENTKTTSCLLSAREQNWLLTAVAKITNPTNEKNLNARIVLDGGSKRTFITTETANRLNLSPSLEEKLIIDTVGDGEQQEVVSKIVQFHIHTITGEKINIEANTIPKIINDIDTFNPEELPNRSILEGKQLADTSNRTDVQILIGIDHLYDILTSEIVKTDEHQYLINSKLGWLFAGKLTKNKRNSKRSSCLLLKTLQAETNDDLKKLWELDTLGIKETPEMTEKTALDIFEETVNYKDNRYEVAWPWIDDNPDLKSHYGLALSRLENLVKKSSDEFLSKYDNVFQEYLKENIIEQVDETKPAENIIHYLPHHGVETTSKSTPLRPVFDASAKQAKNDKSLNDCLFKGQNLNELLAMLLLAFQTSEYGIIGDIRRAFLQLLLAAKDRDSVRFLWLKNVKLKTTVNNVVVFRFLRILFGANASPFLLAAVLRHHLTKYPGSIASKLLKSLYVDNVATGADSIEEAISLIESIIKIFSEASMTLRQWQTNSKELKDHFPGLDWTEDAVVSLLGLNWNTSSDTYSIKATTFHTVPTTKRNILKNSSKIYDPLGYFAAVTLKAKLILRQLWQENYDWDQPVSPELESDWQQLVSEFEKLSHVEIPRKFPLLKTESTLQLHVFADASQNAYGATVYVRLENQTEIATKLLFAKSRVAPLKTPMKIPRLELLAAQVGVRALNFVEESLRHCKIAKKFLWSDSMCVVGWINSTKILPSVLERRVNEIRKSKLSVHYVKSGENPADLASRGGVLSDLNDQWQYGPTWLREDESKWPTALPKAKQEEFELKQQDNATLLTHETARFPPKPFEIEPENFLELNDLLLETKNRMKTSNSEANFKTAEKMWIKYMQQVHFSKELECTRNDTEKTTNLTKQLNLIQDDQGILRVKGRLSNLEQDTSKEFPILLPSKDYLVQLLLIDTHQKLYHAGVSQTLAEIRKNYWLLRGRQTVYNVIRKCKNCRVFSGPAYKYPILPPLPDYRLKRELAFAHVGVDVLGPLYVRKLKKDEMKKNWVCLFTCLITRAVHLEVLENMTSEELLGAFRQMIARRGIPKFVLSDNAPQFNVLKNLIANEPENHLEKLGIEWKQIPEFSPWSGGIYERIVALVKNALKRTFYHTTLTRRQLQISISEIEAVINSRPIVYVGADDKTVLSPRDLLNIPLNIPTDFEPVKGSNILQTIAENWKKGQQQLDAFWEIWRREYIESLRPVKQIREHNRVVNELPKLGDTVLLHEKFLPRGRWKTGRITKLNTSSDGAVRSAVIQQQNGTEVTKPINLLHPLESEVQSPTAQNQSKDENSPVENGHPERPKRKAAEEARGKILQWAKDL